MEKLNDLFPGLTARQKDRFEALEPLYREWNERINVVSRKDIDQLHLHHVLHSLAIAKVAGFTPGSTVLDVGTGGGFPGIPLAIYYPECHFTLCDSVGKKIKVAQAVADALDLNNVSCVNARVESLPGRFDYAVSRAVTELATFYPWVRRKVDKAVFYLKGGELDAEIAACARQCRIDPGRFIQTPISRWFSNPWFEGKKIVTILQ